MFVFNMGIESRIRKIGFVATAEKIARSIGDSRFSVLFGVMFLVTVVHYYFCKFNLDLG